MSDAVYKFMGANKNFVHPAPGKFGIGVKIHWRLDNEGLARHGMTMGWAAGDTLRIADGPNYANVSDYHWARVFIIGVIDTSLMDYTPVAEIKTVSPLPEKRQPINIKDFPVGSKLTVKFPGGSVVKVEIVAWGTTKPVPDHARLIDADNRHPILFNDGIWTPVQQLEIVREPNEDHSELDPSRHPAGTRLKVVNKLYPSTDFDVVILGWRGEYVKIHVAGGRGHTAPAQIYRVAEVLPVNDYNEIDYPIGSRLVVDVVHDGEYSGEIQVSVNDISHLTGLVLLQKLNGSPFFEDSESDSSWCKFSEVNVIEVLPPAQPPETINDVPDFIVEEQSDDELGRQFHQHLRELKRIGELLSYNVSVTIV